MTQKTVFTDFDGTYIKGDSYIRSIIYFNGYVKFIKMLPGLFFSVIEHYLGFISRNEVKRRSFELAYKGLNIRDIEKKLPGFIAGMHIFPKVKRKLKELREIGCRIIVVTASPDIYMIKAAEKFGFDGCICTETEKEDSLLTGKLKRKNCNYDEKVHRIKTSRFWDPAAEIIAFGNSKGDEEMLKLAREFYSVDKKGNLKKGKFTW